ncbi:hypothetical protein PHEL49_1369 [Polaribacter sp. Hel1_33_49]|nr:hypothetical protein PHEL49_1369 [Polaribacter sp. Hel1_33_49]
MPFGVSVCWVLVDFDSFLQAIKNTKRSSIGCRNARIMGVHILKAKDTLFL